MDPKLRRQYVDMISRFPPPAFDPTKFNTEMKSLISKALSLAFVLVILTIRQPLLLCICSIAVERIHKSMDKTFRQSLLLLLIPAFLLAVYGSIFSLGFIINKILEWFPIANVCGLSLSCLILCGYYCWQENRLSRGNPKEVERVHNRAN